MSAIRPCFEFHCGGFFIENPSRHTPVAPREVTPTGGPAVRLARINSSARLSVCGGTHSASCDQSNGLRPASENPDGPGVIVPELDWIGRESSHHTISPPQEPE